MESLAARQIRILDILPYGTEEEKESPIQCQYHTAFLADKPEYEALSYRWGDASIRVEINVCGRPMYVTNNLHHALLRLRHRDEPRAVWIDQICINQDDIDEKVAQVRLMREIYSQCTRCVIWLDEIPDEVGLDDAAGFIRFIEYLADFSDPEVPACIATEEASQRLFEPLRTISIDEHPWWNRIWTVQEIMLPQNKTFLWGPLELTWDTLCAAMDNWLADKGPPEILRTQEIPGFNHHMNTLLTNSIWINDDHDQLSIMTIWRHREATDPRDKVFGLLGLIKPDQMELQYTHECGYEHSVAQVYAAFTIDLILADDLEAIGYEFQRADPGTRAEGIPGWAVDLGGKVAFEGATGFQRYWGDIEYDACAGEELDSQLIHDTIAESGWQVLGLRGLAVDTIEYIGAKILWHIDRLRKDEVPDDELISTTLQSWLENAKNYCKRERIHIQEKEFTENFYRLVLGDCFRDSQGTVIRAATDEDVETSSKLVNDGIRDYSWDNKALFSQVVNQAFFVTKTGIMGMGHLNTKHGDQLWVLDGGNAPFSLRARGDDSPDDLDFVGYCYAQGIMRGEAYKEEGALDRRRKIRVH